MSEDFVPAPKRECDGLATPEERFAWCMKEYEELKKVDPEDGMTFTNKTSAMIAYERDLESRKPEADRICNDFLAKHFVGKYGKRVSDAMAVGLQPSFDLKMEGLKFEGHIQYTAARTRLISDSIRSHLTELKRSGFECQVLNLGSGLDTRAFWDDSLKGTSAYIECDEKAVNDYKNGVLDELKSKGELPDPLVSRTIVSMDFKTESVKDIPSKVDVFDVERPTCWILEGLVMYLTAEENTKLLTEISSISGKDSYIILNFVADSPACKPDDHDKLLQENDWEKVDRVFFGDEKFNFGKYPASQDPSKKFGFSFYKKK
eukprot:m.60239 g.60239  ORF g.60239 m.60239 type:complete len:318 (-) comp11305_c2_seq2:78-1031(-)